MNGNMNPTTEELELLALEISEVRDVLRELSQQVVRIERRVQAALPPANRKQTKSGKNQKITDDDARRIIDGLTKRAQQGEQIEKDLRKMTVKGGLAVLARALGLTNSKLPPKDELVRRISTRLRQRAAVENGMRGSGHHQKTTLSSSQSPFTAS